jgi:5-methylcytosine-specific restriction endonuclease McrA
MAAANPRYANGHRRRALRRRVLAHYNDCALCGQPVDKTLPPDDPGAPEVDEILPISLGGNPYAWHNVQLAHRICNQRKGNRVDAPPIAMSAPTQPITSRVW